MKRHREMWMRQGVALAIAFIFSLGLSFSTFAQSSSFPEFSQNQIDDVLDRLTEIRGTISSLTFDKENGVTEDRRAELEKTWSQILSRLDALLGKTKEESDISGELAYFDRRSVTNGIAYFLSYEENLKLLDDIFRKDAYPHAGTGDRASQQNTTFNRIHRALNERIYLALLSSLNENRLDSWDQMAFVTTVGHADNLRVYIDRRALDLEAIEQIAHWELSGIRDAVNQSGVLEDLYQVITNRDPVEPLALARMDLSDLSTFSAEYIGAVFRFALETIKHNQLFYAPLIPEERNPTFVLQVEPENEELPRFQESPIEADNTNLLRQEAHLKLPGAEKAPPAPTFEEKHPSERITELIAIASAAGHGDYFTPYMMLLMNADSMVEDYAGEVAKRSQKGQHLAYALAQEGKMFSFVVTGVLAGASFITGPLGMAANLLFLSTLAMDEVKIAFQEYDEGMPVGEIMQTHAKSMALYGWMGATRLKVVKMALQKAPILHFGISAYFVKDLSTALIANHKQTQEINRAERMGQMGAMEASLARMDLLNSTLSTAALLGHNVRGAASGLNQMTARRAPSFETESLQAQPIVVQNGFLPTSFKESPAKSKRKSKAKRRKARRKGSDPENIAEDAQPIIFMNDKDIWLKYEGLIVKGNRFENIPASMLKWQGLKFIDQLILEAEQGKTTRLAQLDLFFSNLKVLTSRRYAAKVHSVEFQKVMEKLDQTVREPDPIFRKARLKDLETALLKQKVKDVASIKSLVDHGFDYSREVSRAEKMKWISERTIEDYLMVSHLKAEWLTAEFVDKNACAIPKALEGESGDRVRAMVIKGDRYFTKTFYSHKAGEAEAHNAMRSAEWFQYNGVGEQHYLVAYPKQSGNIELGKRGFEVVADKVPGLNIKDAILNPYKLERWRSGRTALIRGYMEKILGKKYETVEETYIEFAKSVFQDKVLVEQMDAAKALLQESFVRAYDVQFMLQPEINGQPRALNFIDAGTNRMSTKPTYSPSSSTEFNYLLHVLKKISETKPGQEIPWNTPEVLDPWAFPMK